MKAVRLNQYGQAVHVEDIPQPTPANDEVLVRVHAVSLNPVDSFTIGGYLQAMQQLPMTLGTDFAGDVVSVGSDVTHVKPGDAVYGLILIRGGAFAEYAAPKSNEVARKPESLNYEQAAAVPLAALAAWQSLIDSAQAQAGERVLILGAGGNVVSFAIQLAENKGITVVAVDRPGKEAFLRELGADEIVNTKTQRFEDLAGPVDVVLNYANDTLLEASYGVLRAGGRYVSMLGQPDQEDARRRGIRSVGLATQPTVDHLTQVAELIDAGKLKVFVHRVFPIEEIQAALEYQQAEVDPGKVVLTLM